MVGTIESEVARMQSFPRTKIGGLELSRLVIGTNNIMGGSHRTRARDVHIKSFNNEASAVCAIVEAYLEHGVDAIIGCVVGHRFALDGIRMAEQRTGRKVTLIELAVFDVSDTAEGRASAADHMRLCAECGVDICLPLHFVVEKLVNKGAGRIDRIGDYLYMIRENGMVPGLSAHMPEIVTYADANGYDVEVYIQIYNAIGFLMQIEVELVHKIIWGAKKPVLTIKPMAAGHLNPFVGLNFVWNTIRDKDLVAVGCMTPAEVHETVEYSLAALDRRLPIMDERIADY
ncbi:MAG: hypothetical protein FWE70_00065 [Oscillospiraceae bacterium]|nr:hypothetical protein [Oscillospiraceae bacterium]